MPRAPADDPFVRERLPPPDAWPDISVVPGAENGSPLNCAYALLDRHVDAGEGDRTAIVSDDESLSYAMLRDRADRIAHVLKRDLGVNRGNRVLLRGFNSPTLAAAWLAVQKCGAVAVTTMPLLRAAELSTIIRIARPTAALCEAELSGELEQAIRRESIPIPVLDYGGSGVLGDRMARYGERFDNCATAADTVSLIGFTSGTTGRPKATVHFHRDVMAICRSVADAIVRPAPGDVFIGTAPLAFTFGLGGLLLFPLHGGATVVLNRRYSAESFADAVIHHRATVCFTVPTFYRRIAPLLANGRARTLRLCVSSGEALPHPVRDQWRASTGVELTELLGSTEMLHAFVGATGDDVRPGFIGPALPGYQLAIVDDSGNPLPTGRRGLLAVKGPTGCRYLGDPRQSDYVRQGWNVTGDTCELDEDGYVRYVARSDDLIVSAGYNISGVEVENVLLEHPDVLECAVVGTPDPSRGQVVAAFVVAKSPPDDASTFSEALKQHVRDRLAPYKYPRTIHLVDALPRNESGKLQRFRLRESRVVTA